MMQSRFLFLAALAGFTGVAMGAFGAHGLKHMLTEHYLEVYRTAVNYQMWHALLLGIIATLPEQRLLCWAGWASVIGIVLFSGSLYMLAISKIGWLGMVTPFGGLAFLMAWGLVAYTAFYQRK